MGFRVACTLYLLNSYTILHWTDNLNVPLLFPSSRRPSDAAIIFCTLHLYSPSWFLDTFLSWRCGPSHELPFQLHLIYVTLGLPCVKLQVYSFSSPSMIVSMIVSSLKMSTFGGTGCDENNTKIYQYQLIKLLHNIIMPKHRYDMQNYISA